MPPAATPTLLDEFSKGLWRENPVFVLVLGLCPSLAVTNSLINGVAMGGATLFVLLGSSILVSLLRKAIPKPVRIAAYIIIISTFVTIADFVLAAFLPEVHKQLGAFIALIVVNCMILGRAEAFASRHSVGPSVADALGMSAGFTAVLVVLGGMREILGNGTLGGVVLFGDRFEPWVVMKLPPGGFLGLGFLLVMLHMVKGRLERRKAQAVSPPDTPDLRRAA